jgi:hypothetical protein
MLHDNVGCVLFPYSAPNTLTQEVVGGSIGKWVTCVHQAPNSAILCRLRGQGVSVFYSRPVATSLIANIRLQGKYMDVTHSNMAWTTITLTSELVGDTLIMGGMIFYLRRGRTIFEKYVILTTSPSCAVREN